MLGVNKSNIDLYFEIIRAIQEKYCANNNEIFCYLTGKSQSIVEPNAKNKLKSSILFHCMSVSYEFSFGNVIKEHFQREGKMMQKHDPLARTFFEIVL